MSTKRPNYHGYGSLLNNARQPTGDEPLLVAFTGKVGSGKSSSCEIVLSKYQGIKVSWADALKVEVYDYIDGGMAHEANSIMPEALRQYLELNSAGHQLDPLRVLPNNEEKIAWINGNKKVLRPLLQWWGTDFRRSQDENYWVAKGIERIKNILDQKRFVAIVNDDTRFENEANALRDLGFALVRINIDVDEQEVRVKGRDGAFDRAIRSHASEIGLDHFLHDFTLDNSGDYVKFLNVVKQIMNEILIKTRRLSR
jgi:dephospho-CoA kinase